MRAFVAITLPEDVLDALEQAQMQFSSGRRVSRENLHLTLAFLDDQPAEALEALHEELELLRSEEFSVALTSLGCFGGNRPRLVFAEVAPNPVLDALYRQVMRAVRRAGLTVKRQRFHPHVTLLRLNRQDDETGRLGKTLTSLAGLRFPEFPVRSTALFRSDLYPSGPIYHELARYELS